MCWIVYLPSRRLVSFTGCGSFPRAFHARRSRKRSFSREAKCRWAHGNEKHSIWGSIFLLLLSFFFRGGIFHSSHSHTPTRFGGKNFFRFAPSFRTFLLFASFLFLFFFSFRKYTGGIIFIYLSIFSSSLCLQ